MRGGQGRLGGVRTPRPPRASGGRPQQGELLIGQRELDPVGPFGSLPRAASPLGVSKTHIRVDGVSHHGLPGRFSLPGPPSIGRYRTAEFIGTGLFASVCTDRARSVHIPGLCISCFYQRGFHLMKLWNGFDAACWLVMNSAAEVH